jgi:Rrf2 family transcriptional regulator, iron-sulfur cluster assembly transcription factor
LIRLTRAGDYAARAVLHLASLEENEIADRESVSKAQEIPLSFLSKILQQLASSGLIRSYKGSSGGFCLARPAEKITFLDVIIAVEGPLALNQCLIEPTRCDRTKHCPIHPVWKKAQSKLEEALNSITFAEIVLDNNDLHEAKKIKPVDRGDLLD